MKVQRYEEYSFIEITTMFYTKPQNTLDWCLATFFDQFLQFICWLVSLLEYDMWIFVQQSVLIVQIQRHNPRWSCSKNIHVARIFWYPNGKYTNDKIHHKNMPQLLQMTLKLVKQFAVIIHIVNSVAYGFDVSQWKTSL